MLFTVRFRTCSTLLRRLTSNCSASPADVTLVFCVTAILFTRKHQNTFIFVVLQIINKSVNLLSIIVIALAVWAGTVPYLHNNLCVLKSMGKCQSSPPPHRQSFESHGDGISLRQPNCMSVSSPKGHLHLNLCEDFTLSVTHWAIMRVFPLSPST
jgi:hypothetical protein